MSGLIGSPTDRLNLPRAIDLLAASARQAGKPGWIWIAGLLYPGIKISTGIVLQVLSILDASTDLELIDEEQTKVLFSETPFSSSLLLPATGEELATTVGAFFLALPLWLVFLRVIMGLVWLSPQRNWDAARGERRAPRLRDAWRSGRGLTVSAIGLWFLMRLLNFVALLFLIGPVITIIHLTDLDGMPKVLLVALLPVVLLLAAYSVVLEVLTQLGLHSLARNKRGTGSALTHAWRLARNSPWSTIRATAVVVALEIATALAGAVLAFVLGCVFLLGVFLAIALYAYVGVVRALYWSRVYSALGGLDPRDVVPGLVPAE